MPEAMRRAPPMLNDQLNGLLERYSISKSAFNTLAQSLGADSDMLMAQILGGAVRLSILRPELLQLITNLFSGLDMYLSEAARARQLRHDHRPATDERSTRRRGCKKPMSHYTANTGILPDTLWR